MPCIVLSGDCAAAATCLACGSGRDSYSGIRAVREWERNNGSFETRHSLKSSIIRNIPSI